MIRPMHALLLTAWLSFGVSAEPPATAEDEVLIVRNHQDQRFWKALPGEGSFKAPAYPKELLRAGVSGCVAIGFYIESDGSTSNYRILNSVIGNSNSGIIGKKDKRAITSMFGNATVKVMEGVRYAPGPENPGKKRGFSYIPASFAADSQSLLRNCDIPDLEVFLSQKLAQKPS